MSFRSSFFCAALLFATACGSSTSVKPPEIHPAQGALTNNGKAVSGGVVQFTPDKLAEFLVKGDVDASGKFELFTHTNGKQEKGAPAGNYTVMYTASVGAPPLITKKTYVVEAGKTNEFTIELIENE